MFVLLRFYDFRIAHLLTVRCNLQSFTFEFCTLQFSAQAQHYTREKDQRSFFLLCTGADYLFRAPHYTTTEFLRARNCSGKLSLLSLPSVFSENVNVVLRCAVCTGRRELLYKVFTILFIYRATVATRPGPNMLAQIFAYFPLLEQGWHKVWNLEYCHKIGIKSNILRIFQSETEV